MRRAISPTAVGHAHEPRHRDLQRSLCGREYVHLERPASLRRTTVGAIAFSPREHADGRAPHGSCGRAIYRPVRLAAAGAPLHHDFARQGSQASKARWSTLSARCRWSGPSARIGREHQPLRRDRRPRDDGAAQAACSISSDCACCTPALTVVLTAGAARLGDRAVATRRGEAGDVVLVCTLGFIGAACHPRPRGRARRRHATHGAPAGGDRHPVAAAWPARASRGGAAGAAAQGHHL